MSDLATRFQRLCRLMCGRSLTFRPGIFRTYRGYSPKRGEAPIQRRSRARWGKAATAHQTAKPRRELISVVIVLAMAVGFTLTAAARRTARNEQQMNVPDNADYSKFQHTTAYHARLPCLLCHRRETNSPRPAMPASSNHLPCAGCHKKQFADSGNAICTICHSNTQSGALKPFPRLSSFNMRFDHARHQSLGNVKCVTCHRPRGGAAMTIPSGFNAHVTCFQCHAPGAKSGDKDISSCSVCHQSGQYVRTRETSPAFRVGFSHAKHDRDENLNCADCHRVRTGVAQRVQVTAPQPLNHHAAPNVLSCMSCHNGKRAFGGDDFGACKRCHNRDTWHF
jgi:c(7)-type cytochrome triheme protein